MYRILAALTLVAGSISAASLGRVVPIGGSAADIALDETRGVLYISNFTANRIEVMSLATGTIRSSINVSAQPGSMAMSPDGRWLLVAQYGNNAAPASTTNALTLIDLSANNAKQTFALGNAPLCVAFAIDGKALVVTTQEFLQFDPQTGLMKLIGTPSGVAAKTLPVPPANFPADITMASVAVSGDGRRVYGMAGGTSTITFRYDAFGSTVSPGGVVLASGTIGPRVVSLNRDGSTVMAGWLMIDGQGTFLNDIPQRTNAASIGTTVFDNKRNLIYAHIPATAGEAPTLQLLDVDNLTLRERFNLPENTTGKSLLSSDNNTMYSVSDSGVLILPVGNLNSAPRLSTGGKELVFRGNFCDRRIATQTLTITDPGGGRTAFSISPSAAGVTISPSSGVTPATVRVTVDPNVFQAQKGTSTVMLNVVSAQAVNAVAPIRVLINSREPDQRGTFVNVPGTLVDAIADPVRDRYYILRQDQNQVLVFDASNNTQIGTLRTYNVPSAMAITLDKRYLLVGHYDSQTIAVYDLETLQAMPYISVEAGAGNTVHSLAVSNKAILATSTDFQGKGHVLKIDFSARSATQLATLGIFQNTIATDAVVVASSNGAKALVAGSDGSVYLYDANADTFTVGRSDFKGLSGAYAASSFDQFVVGPNMLNASLVPVGQFETASGSTTGFLFLGDGGIRTTSPNAQSAGIVQRVDLGTLSGIRPTRMVESPILKTPAGGGASVFTKTLVYVPSRGTLINLTTSGFTVLPPAYDASVAPPSISAIVSAADNKSPGAPGGLISLYGARLSPTNLATQEIPVPTALGDSCLTVNGEPIPMIFVSPTQINAQMPFQAVGNVAVTVHTPGGVSDNFNMTVPTAAPALFSVALNDTTLPAIVRTTNRQIVTNSNPIHRNDTLEMYVTGLGQVSPLVDAGAISPSDPPASALSVPEVKLGGVTLPVDFAGLSPGSVGLYQINVRVPGDVPQGLTVPLTIKQGNSQSSFDVRVVQ